MQLFKKNCSNQLAKYYLYYVFKTKMLFNCQLYWGNKN
jgi:hypothetical protein